MKVAYLEDDLDQAQLISAQLEELGLECSHFASSEALLNNLHSGDFDGFILDIVLPDIRGTDVLTRIRDMENTAPVIFVTNEDSETQIVTALEAGADDYMVKPVKARELAARLNAVARRYRREETSSIIDLPPYRINSTYRSIEISGEQIPMTHKEYDLALYFFTNIGRIIPRGELLEKVWGTSPDITTRRVDTHISRLRQKLNMGDEGSGWNLHSIYQHGYRLEKLAAI